MPAITPPVLDPRQNELRPRCSLEATEAAGYAHNATQTVREHSQPVNMPHKCEDNMAFDNVLPGPPGQVRKPFNSERRAAARRQLQQMFDMVGTKPHVGEAFGIPNSFLKELFLGLDWPKNGSAGILKHFPRADYEHRVYYVPLADLYIVARPDEKCCYKQFEAWMSKQWQTNRVRVR